MDTPQNKPKAEEGKGTSIYFTYDNLAKLDDLRGVVKRSTFINLMIEHSSKAWLKKLLK